VLFTNAETTAIIAIMANMPIEKLFLNVFESLKANTCNAPDFKMAWLKINIKATVIVAELLKPSTPSSGVITPEKISTNITKMATKSIVITSVAKRITAQNITLKTMFASVVKLD